jgi:hypothetical protein
MATQARFHICQFFFVKFVFSIIIASSSLKEQKTQKIALLPLPVSPSNGIPCHF